MKPSTAFAPAFTVPNYHQQLSAVRPIQVYTYDFQEKVDCAPGRQDNTFGAWGAIYAWNGIDYLPPHDHEHHEVALIVAGTATLRTAYNARPLARGSVLTASPSDTHAFEHIDGLCMVNCTYLTEYLFYDVREIFSVAGLAPLFFRESVFGPGLSMAPPQWVTSEETLAACLHELHDLAAERAREDVSPVYMRRTLEKLLVLLCRSFHESGEELHVPGGGEIQALLERIEEVIEAGQSFDASALARETGLSRDRLAKRFRSAMGCTPTDYYQHRRIQHASRLLLDSNRTATDVAYELGYYDAAHFSRLFKRYRGMTPRAFRARYVDRC